MVTNVRLCCPVGCSEELTAVLKLKNSQIGTEIDKKPKIFQFSKFSCICCQNFDGLRGLELWTSRIVENGHQSKNVLSSSLL